jgi:hypothetical protein
VSACGGVVSRMTRPCPARVPFSPPLPIPHRLSVCVRQVGTCRYTIMKWGHTSRPFSASFWCSYLDFSGYVPWQGPLCADNPVRCANLFASMSTKRKSPSQWLGAAALTLFEPEDSDGGAKSSWQSTSRAVRRQPRKRTRRTPRRAICFRCGVALTEDTDSRCDGCGWLICACDACGCHYSGTTTLKC